MPHIRVTLLGGFAASVDGVAVPETAWRLKKARELVKLLALAPGHRLQREQAMDELWRDREPAAAANNLNQAVHVARRALGADAIEVRDGGLQLDADVDADLLEQAAADARRAGTAPAYRAALSLYGGELLPENRYDEWAEGRRDELADLVAELEGELAALGSGELDALPPLPVSASSFVGRERELAQLVMLLRGTRMLTLAGTGGVGKTRLALEAARRAAAAHSGGAAFAGLAALADARLVPDAVAAALDLRALPGQTLTDAVIGFLAPRDVLLVVDNCEHLLAATSAFIGELLSAAPGLTVLATSREPLRVPGEVVFRVPSLDIPDPEQAGDGQDLLGYESVRLFVERASAAAPGFVLDERTAADVARICLRLDGLPLALELAAGRVGALGPAAIAERLDDRFRVLRTASHASPTRQQTLTATLQWSHDLLAPDERILFRRLAVFAGGLDLEAVEAVCAGGDLDEPGIADVLGRLVEKSLVAVDDPAAAERRYRLGETVRIYARERLAESGETEALTERHAHWALARAERDRSSPRLDRDEANLRVALDTLLARAPEDALRMCVALWPFWLRRIDLQEAQRRFDAALAGVPEPCALRARGLLAAAAIDYRSGALSRGMPYAEESCVVAGELGDARAQWRALQFLGEFGIASDAVDVATPWLQQALELAGREGFAAGEAICVYSLGVAQWIAGDLPRADELVGEALARFRAIEGSPELFTSPVTIAEIRWPQPDGRPGRRLIFEDTLQPFLELTAETAIGYVLGNRAAIARDRGDLARARALLEESAAHAGTGGDERRTASLLVRRAYLELAEGAPAVARSSLQEALQLRRRHRDRRGTGLALAGLGLIDTTAGDHDSAEAHLGEACDIFRRAGDRWGLASTLWRTADLAFARGDLDGAYAALQEARVVLGATRRERWIATTLAALAEVAELREDQQTAIALLGEARDRYAARADAAGVADVEQRLAALG